MKIHLLPGLGFDHRIFQKLKLEKFKPNYINWIEPKGQESIQAYAKRMSESIEDKPNQHILIGHSFGGILCQEISSIKPIEKIILISSIKSRAENPLYFRIIQPLKLYRLFTKELTLPTFRFWAHRHDYVIPGAGHFMVFKQPEIIGNILENELKLN